MTARSLKKVEGILEFDPNTTMRVVESLVIKGDISGLSADEKLRYYVQMCESLGLNPAAQPFAVLKLSGKEVLYASRGATDQLAAIHKLNREIIDGPKVIDLGGVKLVYAVCRATHPNGRIETAVATLPLGDPVNVLMKCETKAKRRATLSILGLGMLDESELETIPSHFKGSTVQVDVPGAEPTAQELAAADAAHALPAADPLPADPAASQSPPEMPKALEDFHADVEQIEILTESVTVWVKHRAAIALLQPHEREAAWKLLCAKTEQVGKIKNPKAWLKKALANSETDKQKKPENDQFEE